MKGSPFIISQDTDNAKDGRPKASIGTCPNHGDSEDHVAKYELWMYFFNTCIIRIF